MATKLNLLGQFEIILPNDKPLAVTSKNGQIILAMLALEKDNCLSRDKLIGTVWATRSEQQARNSLRQTLSSLRKLFGNHGLGFFKADYTNAYLCTQELEIDILKIPSSPQGLCTAELETIIHLYRDQFLSNLYARDITIMNWLDSQRNYFNKQRMELLSQLTKRHYEKADFQNVINTGNQALGYDPLNEQIHRMMMQAFLASGNRVAAIKQYHLCCQSLKSELAISPSEKTTAVYQIIYKSMTESQLVNHDKRQIVIQDGFSEKPTIAILPFKNISQNQEQDSLCAGLTDDISTYLSRFRDLLVIRNRRTRKFNHHNQNTNDTNQQPHVEFMLEGCLQIVANRIRISIKLIEVRTGIQLWSEIYNRNLDKLDEIQDEVSQRIVATLASAYGGRLRKAWQHQNHKTPTLNNRAFDYFTQAIDYANAYTAVDNQRARQYFEKAIRVDPEYAKAYSGVACTHLLDAVESWKNNYDACMDNCLYYTNKALECDDSESWCYWQLAVYYIYTMQHELALIEFEKAIQLNPNDADVLADAGYYYSYSGHNQKGLEYARKAMQLNPHYPDYYTLQLGQILFDAHQYEQAIITYKKSYRAHSALANLYLAASYAAIGQKNDSTRAINDALKFDANACVQKWTDRRFSPYKFSTDLDHFRQHLKTAGLH